jgi:hypothetical protein
VNLVSASFSCPRERNLTSEVLEQLDLSQGSLGQNLLAEDIGDLLDM